VGNFFKRTVDITEYRDAENEVNRAQNRAFGGIVHDGGRVSGWVFGGHEAPVIVVASP
jgi:hypothetical protein